MKSPEEQQDAASNLWFKKRIYPVIDDECQVALRFLQRHMHGKHFGNPESFAHSTMQSCASACLEIARSLTDNSAASLEIRASAMKLMVSHTLIYPRTTRQIDKEVLKCLLQEEATDNYARIELVTLTRALALSVELWQDTNQYIEMALGKICKDLKIEPSVSMNRPSGGIETADKCIKALMALISQPPNGK